VFVDAGYEERYWYPDDGGQIWVAGYQLVDPDSGRYLARDAPELAALGVIVAGVAGAGRHHAEAPRELAAELAPELDEGRAWSALVLRELRRSPREPRHGLTMLLAPDAEVELRVSGA
jgi:hypothetical protein